MIALESIENTIVNKNSTVKLVEKGIVHIKWKSDIELEEKDVDDVSAAFNELSKGEIVCVISHFGEYVNITPTARDYAANQSPKCIALAYVLNGLAQRLVIKFYIRIRKRKNPTKVFNSYEDALKWVKSFNRT